LSFVHVKVSQKLNKNNCKTTFYKNPQKLWSILIIFSKAPKYYTITITYYYGHFWINKKTLTLFPVFQAEVVTSSRTFYDSCPVGLNLLSCGLENSQRNDEGKHYLKNIMIWIKVICRIDCASIIINYN